MPTNPEELHAQSTEVLSKPQTNMEALQQRAVPSSPPANETHREADSAETHVDEAPMVRYAIGKLRDFLQWFMVSLEVMLAIRFFFKLIGASETNLFAGLLYSLTDIVLFPFHNIVENAPDRFAADAVIAMIIYWLLFVAVQRFLHILITGPEETTA